MTIDLHMHTTASDGEHSPQDLIDLAHAAGLTTIAITDHDTTDGIRPAIAAAEKYNITVIPGIEFSAETDEDVHMLGYFIDIDHTEFQERLKVLRENRLHRGKAMITKLNSLGVDITFEQVQRIAGDAPIVRPHVGRAIVEAGYAESVQDAFDRYIDNHAPGYVSRIKLSPEEAIDLIHLVGGKAVMAHPGLVKSYETVLPRLIEHGLDGVELNHPKNPAQVRERVRKIGEAHGLIFTGGSDFHHRNRADGSIALGSESPPPGMLERLRGEQA